MATLKTTTVTYNTAGEAVFAVDGSLGRLLCITDDLSDSIFSVNTIAGLPVIEAFADNSVNIGTYGAYQLHVHSTGVIMAGNVGIGTTTPNAKLDVNGNVIVTGSIVATSNISVNSSINTPAATTLTLNPSNGRTMHYGSSAAHYIDLYNQETHTTRIYSAGYSYFNGGNVGIGTTGPSAKLHVNGTGDGEIARLSYAAGADQETILGFTYRDSGGANTPVQIGYHIATDGWDNNTYGHLVFKTRNVMTDTAPTERMRITNAGNVGIGTTAPATKFDIIVPAASTMMTLGAVTGIGLSIRAADANAYGMYFGVDNSGKSWIQGGRTNTATAYDISLQAAGGNVGIGTTAPSAKLSINGGLHVGGDTDPGDDNLLVDGTILVAGTITFNQPGTGTYNKTNVSANSSTYFLLDIARTTNSDTAAMVPFYLKTAGQSTTYSAIQVGGTSSNTAPAYVGIGGAWSTSYALYVTGAIGATGDITSNVTSDKRFKKNVLSLKNSLLVLSKIRPVAFEWNKKAPKHLSGQSVGVIAQELRKVLPSVVTEREDGTLAVDYVKLIPYTIAALQELEARVKKLEAR